MQAQYRADRLRNDGGHGGGPHAPAEHAHAQQIQRDVQAGGNDKIVQRMPGIAHGVEDAVEDVVQDIGQHPGKIEAQIGHGLRHHALRRAQPAQDGGAHRHAENRQRRAGDQTQGDVGVDGAGDLAIVAGTEIPGHHHARAQRGAGKEIHQQQDQRAGGRYAGQRGLAQKLAHDQGVRRVVQLLEQQAEHQRHGKIDNGPAVITRGHVFCPGGLWHFSLSASKIQCQ